MFLFVSKYGKDFPKILDHMQSKQKKSNVSIPPGLTYNQVSCCMHSTCFSEGKCCSLFIAQIMLVYGAMYINSRYDFFTIVHGTKWNSYSWTAVVSVWIRCTFMCNVRTYICIMIK